MIRKLFFLMLLAVLAFASEPTVIPLWPGAAPGSESWNYEEGVPQDASHPIDHCIRLYAAWKKLGIPAELHIYSAGGHGFGTRKISLPAGTWTDRFRDWLGVQGFLKRPQG